MSKYVIGQPLAVKDGTKSTDILERFLSAEMSPDETTYFSECEFLRTAIQEVVKGEVRPGDGFLYDEVHGGAILAAKARQVLLLGAKHIIQGRPSAEFLKFVATSIIETINGGEVSLDHAFRLVLPAHRPQGDPYAEPAVDAYLNSMGQFLATIDGTETQVQRERNLEVAQRVAIDSAYTAKWGNTPQKDKERSRAIKPEKNAPSEDAIKKRKKEIRDVLKKLGSYTAKQGK